MPYVNKPRPYKKEYQQEKKRGEREGRSERQRLRRKVDKEYGEGFRKGKDLSHKKALSKGGKNSDGWKLESPSKNRAKGGAMSKPPKKK